MSAVLLQALYFILLVYGVATLFVFLIVGRNWMCRQPRPVYLRRAIECASTIPTAQSTPASGLSQVSSMSAFRARLKPVATLWYTILKDRINSFGNRLRFWGGRMSKPDYFIDYIEGQCPVYGEGSINGIPWYFRARGASWTLDIGYPDVIYEHSEWYGIWPDAGYMTPATAERLIAKAIRSFLDGKRGRKLSDDPLRLRRETQWSRDLLENSPQDGTGA